MDFAIDIDWVAHEHIGYLFFLVISHRSVEDNTVICADLTRLSTALHLTDQLVLIFHAKCHLPGVLLIGDVTGSCMLWLHDIVVLFAKLHLARVRLLGEVSLDLHRCFLLFLNMLLHVLLFASVRIIALIHRLKLLFGHLLEIIRILFLNNWHKG